MSTTFWEWLLGWLVDAHLSGNQFYFKKLFIYSFDFFWKKPKCDSLGNNLFEKDILSLSSISTLIILLRKSDFLKDVQWLNMTHPYYRGANLKVRAYTILARTLPWVFFVEVGGLFMGKFAILLWTLFKKGKKLLGLFDIRYDTKLKLNIATILVLLR